MSARESHGSTVNSGGPPASTEDEVVLKRAFAELHPAATKWKRLGLELDCPPEELELIQRKPANKDDNDFLYCMLYHRQKMIEPSHLTWEVVYRALASPTVGETKLAEKVAKKHCPQLLLERAAGENQPPQTTTASGESVVSYAETKLQLAGLEVILVCRSWCECTTMCCRSSGSTNNGSADHDW